MSKITSDGLTRSGTGCFYSCTHMATEGVKGSNGYVSTSVIWKMFIKYWDKGTFSSIHYHWPYLRP